MSPPNWGRLRGGTDNVKSGLHPTLTLPSMGRETVFVGLKPNLFTNSKSHKRTKIGNLENVGWKML